MLTKSGYAQFDPGKLILVEMWSSRKTQIERSSDRQLSTEKKGLMNHIFLAIFLDEKKILLIKKFTGKTW